MTDSYESLMDGIRRGVTIEEMSKLYASYMLDRHGGNKVHTARELDIDRRTLQRWGIGKEQG